MNEDPSPVDVQEEYYKLPYHWFPRFRYKWIETKEKQRIIYGLIDRFMLRSPVRFLDAGCGDGKWTADIQTHLQATIDVTGIDFSQRAIAFARLISPEIKFDVQSITALQFDDKTFDLVTCIEVIEHLPDAQQLPALRELRRVLVSDGLLILTVPSTLLRMPPHHFRHYTPTQLTDLLLQSGFTILAKTGQSLPWYGRKRSLRNLAGRLPIVWKLWNFTFREMPPHRATNLIFACRPEQS